MEEVKIYIETHGHMNVTMKENKSLNLWIANVRCSYRKIQKGQPSHMTLTPDQIDMLQQIGFDFECVEVKMHYLNLVL